MVVVRGTGPALEYCSKHLVVFLYVLVLFGALPRKVWGRWGSGGLCLSYPEAATGRF